MSKEEEIGLDLLKDKGLKGIPYLNLVEIRPSREMYDLIKKAEDLGYLPKDTVQIKEITWLPYGDHGWGNGYVSIPKGHLMYGLGYDTLMDERGVDALGGLTYAGEEDRGWVIGFDTAHSFNHSQIHDEDFVKTQTMELLVQVFTMS
tara:strand:- start:772 stop:1212 length:441 start_codon:yes stop_codon:yes gene_type:complete